MAEQFCVKAIPPYPTTQPKCGKSDALVKALIALLKAQNAKKALTTMCDCSDSTPINDYGVRKRFTCKLCSDINRAHSALNNFRSADGVVIDICNCNKH